MSDKTKDVSWLYDPTQHIKVACRLCGDVWSFPIAYEQNFKENPSWECPHCRRQWKSWKGGIK